MSTKGIQNSKENAANYLERHKIKALFEVLTSALLITQPDDPSDFLIQEINKIRDKKKQHQTVSMSNLKSRSHVTYSFRYN